MAGSDSLIGQTVSHYRILEKLGGGGMGVVYKAEDTRLHRAVALKFVPPEMAHDSASLQRFQREAQAASALNHPNICTIHDIGDQDGQPFIALELLEGQTLKQRISGKPLPLDEMLELAIHISDALSAAHAAGVIHRDIKPANIFVTKRGYAKVLDFGLAKLKEPGGAADLSAMPTVSELEQLTQRGMTIGTLTYMSPEQVRGEELDGRTDLFSFGVVLYEMATGVHAFRGETTGVIAEAILNRKPVAPVRLNPNLPTKLEEIITKALEKDRKLRYQNASEIRTDLQRLKRDAQVEPKPAAKSTRFRWVVVTGAAILVIGLAVGGSVFHTHKAHALTDKDTIVLADFTNTTGDAVFDGTLRQGLSVQLEQSPFLSIVPDQQIQQTLQKMGQKPDVKLTGQTTEEICQRTASAAVLEGTISQIGTQYLLTVKAINCISGESLASTEAQASDKNHILDALGKAATEIRSKLGESLSTVQKYDTPLAEATTPSLEALRAYSLGLKVLSAKGDFVAAIPLFQRAIDLDSSFAAAHALLAKSYLNLGENTLAAAHLRKAYELRGRVSDREKFLIESFYFHFVTENLEKARRAYELWEQTYPRDPDSRSVGSGVYVSLGQYDKAIAVLREAVELAPNDSTAYADLVSCYLFSNRLQEGRVTAEEAQAKNLDSPGLRAALYGLAFLEKDSEGMSRQVAWASGKPGVEDVLLSGAANTAAFYGQLGRARELSRQAVASAEHAAEKETAANYVATSAVREALFGKADEARKRSAISLGLSDSRDVQYLAALALALAMDSARSRKVADALGERFSESTVVQFNYLPTIRAQLTLNLKDSSKAIEVLQLAAPHELGPEGALRPVYVRAQAYLAAHRGAEAIAEFQKILDHPGVVGNEPIGVLAHLGLARAYAMQGDTAKARAKYQGFLTIWKDADPDIPVLKKAKAEFAKLQ